MTRESLKFGCNVFYRHHVAIIVTNRKHRQVRPVLVRLYPKNRNCAAGTARLLPGSRPCLASASLNWWEVRV